jgi:intergrase/recombinase
MKIDYKAYEADCARIRESNQQLLEEFAAWLSAQGLGEATIRKHVQNVEFYIDHFLLYEDATEPQDGALRVDMFLGSWFIRKAVWASEATVKASATALKKFYTFLHARGMVSADTLQALQRIIKRDMPKWLKKVRRY